jgi:hypothetical protein
MLFILFVLPPINNDAVAPVPLFSTADSLANIELLLLLVVVVVVVVTTGGSLRALVEFLM